MKRKFIVFSIRYDSLILEYKTADINKEYINTHKMYNEGLFYDLKYFKKNKYSIINNIKKYQINYLITAYNDFELIKFIMELIGISNLKINFMYTISIDDFGLIMNISGIKNLDTYYMPSFIVKKFNDNNIGVKLNNRNIISDRFFLSQDCIDYDALYYRKNLEIKENYEGIYEDIREFLRVNYFLKGVYIRCFDKELINNVINLIREDESKDLIVFLHQINDENNFIKDNFKWLKEINIRCKEENICEFRIVYSDNYIRGNLFKQLTFNNLKLICILGIYLFSISFVISKSYAFVESFNTNKLNIDIMNSMNNIPFEEEEENDVLEDNRIEQDSVSKKLEKKGKYDFDIVFSKLKKINNQTVGFLTINNTKISYPVVQSKDNNYYLNRDFYKNKTSMGWIYMDYRNKANKIDDNTIIYGHNMLNDMMFGTLDKVLNSSWRSNEDNMIISYDTPDGVRLYKIFSAYRVDYTTDYLKVRFNTEVDFNKYIKTVKKRSIFSTKDKIKYGDKLLTLSTCTGNNNKRLVVHAVLIDN